MPIKLVTTKLQHEVMYETLILANEACNYIAIKAFESKVYRQYDIHKLLYKIIRTKFNLSAQMTVRCIGKVAVSFKLNKRVCPKFKLTGSIAYDSRILRIVQEYDFVTIWTILGRIKIPYTTGKYQSKVLIYQKGECDLVFRNDQFYLFCTCDVPEKPEIKVNGTLGIDLGIKNIATTSDNKNYSGAHLSSLRKRNNKLRAKLQSKGTKSAKRLLKKRSKKEHRFATNTNHIISKQIVFTAKHTTRAIVLEDLKHIGKRARVRKSQRNTLSSWSFYQLQQFIDYKAKLQGIPVIYINPKNTSIECPDCGFTEKSNRKSRDLFTCKSCGLAGPADYIAARNIAGRAVVNQPNVETVSELSTNSHIYNRE
jgi:IS605 OrfB family transposase